MEPNYRHTEELPLPKSPVSRRPGGPEIKRSSPAGGAQRFGGIHLRRDKRYPFAKHVVPDMLEIPPAARTSTAAAEPDPLTAWKEAVMLWLSWNSTYERATAKMCKPGYDKSKIEALMDEMDKLRRRAIELSEGLLRS